MDEHVDRLVLRNSLPVGHGQEPEAHADVEPFTHAVPVVGRRAFLGARPLILLGFAHSCNDGGHKSTHTFCKESEVEPTHGKKLHQLTPHTKQ